MKIGLIGAGNNSDYHATFAKAYPGAHIVGVADNDRTRAEECARKHGIARVFTTAADLLKETRPDVVHVVTPPRTHRPVVLEAIDAGCHVIVEKPLALNVEEAQELFDAAERRGVLLSPVHNHLFDPCMRRAHEIIAAGGLGRIVNVESYYGLNTNIPPFRAYPQPNVLPWLYRLPGGVYQDFLPHPLYVLLEYIGAPRALSVMHRSTGVLPQRMPDEISIQVDGERALGTAIVSFAARPHLHYVRIYGTHGMVEVDFNNMTTAVHPLSGLPKAAQKVLYNIDESIQKTRGTISNTLQFVTGKLKPYHGMMTLIHGVYDAVRTGSPAPISKDSALAVVRTMDQVFEQLKPQPLVHERIASVRAPQPSAKRVLVTGGTGFLGKAVVKRLIDDGYRVRVLARKLATVDPIVAMGAEVFWGDVADLASFDEAFAGCDAVIHLAAGTSGSEKDSQTATLQGTRNLLELCSRHRPQRLVYISSCSVYGIADRQKNAVVSETDPLEPRPELRGAYSASKQEAETIVAAYQRSGDVPVVILRPGTIYGPGGDLYTPLLGFAVGSTYLVIGRGAFVLPYVYVDNVAQAISQSIDGRAAAGEVFNVVDPERMTKREYMNRVIRRVDDKARVIYLPYAFLYGMTWLQELAFGLMKRRPVLTRYRLTSSQKHVIYDSRKITSALGWAPAVSLSEALDRLVASQRPKQAAARTSQESADTRTTAVRLAAHTVPAGPDSAR